MKVYLNGAHILHPQDSPPSMTFEIERDAPFTFLASVGTVTLFVEGSIYARGGASEITTGDDVKIYSDSGLLLFGGNVDQEIDWEERDGYASFAVLGWFAAAKKILAGRPRVWTNQDGIEVFGSYADCERNIKEVTGLEGLTLKQASDYGNKLDSTKREIVAVPAAITFAEQSGWYQLTTGFTQEYLFDSRRNKANDQILFPPEEWDDQYNKYTDWLSQNAMPGYYWREVDIPNLSYILMSDIAAEIVAQMNIALYVPGSRYTLDYGADSIEINHRIRILDDVFAQVDFFRRNDMGGFGDSRTFMATLKNDWRYSDTVPELKLYEIKNSYDALQIGNDIKFTLTKNQLVNLSYGQGAGAGYGGLGKITEQHVFGRAKLIPTVGQHGGVNRVLFYQMYTGYTLVPGHYMESGLDTWVSKTACEWILYDLWNNVLIDTGTFGATIEGANAQNLWNGVTWYEVAGELEKPPDKYYVQFAQGYDPNWAKSSLIVYNPEGYKFDDMWLPATNERYQLLAGVPYSTGNIFIRELMFAFKDKSLADVLVEIAKMTNSVLWIDNDKIVHLRARESLTGTLHTIENIISKTPQTIDRTGEEPPEISSDVIDNEFYNRALSKWYNDNFFLQKELAWGIALIPDDTSLAIKLGDRVTWGDGHNYFVSRIQSDRDAVTITCWRALN